MPTVKMEITYGTNTRPITPRALRATVCLAALELGLRAERAQDFPSEAVIQVAGTLAQVKDLCNAAVKGCRFEENRAGDQQWFTVYAQEGNPTRSRQVTAIVKRGEEWAVHI